MSPVERLPTSGIVVEYRGRRYEQHAVDPDSPHERRLALDPGWSPEEFPATATFGGDADNPWVSLGARAIDAAWTRTVLGRWHDCAVLVSSRVRSGTDRGRIVVKYEGTSPAEANAAGFISSPYQYWYALAEGEDLEITEITMEPRQPI